jgi:protein involved in ribonucleotide reduction
MKIVYMSLTGQTKKFVHKLEMDLLEITPTNPYIFIEEPFIAVVPTYEIEATEIMNDFIETGSNLSYFKGVAGGGNLNFGKLFAFTAKDLAERYEVPLLHTFEFQGNEEDVRKLKRAVKELG